MKTRPFLLLLALLLAGQLLASAPVAAQISVRIGPRGYFGPPRAYYGPRYYPPRPAVVYAAPRPVVVVPAPYYAPRPVYYAAPRPYYRGRGYYGRRW
ncbi:hypothetical protein [Hymenobacter sp.]|uniref:hypothetical protein n=1 Tax=Hymenobacter sp. TaxID=1898978 RepID=UPI00286AFD97|nr:hypothetical protein [Hymenobacter sp.]